MSWYALELVELAPDHDAAEIAGALGLDPRALRSLALPATVREGLAEADAELLFHHLHRAGATLRLRPVARSSAPAPASELPLPDLPLPDPPRASTPYRLEASEHAPRSLPMTSNQRPVTGSFGGALLRAAGYPFGSVGVVAMMVAVSVCVAAIFYWMFTYRSYFALLFVFAGLCVLAAYYSFFPIL